MRNDSRDPIGAVASFIAVLIIFILGAFFDFEVGVCALIALIA